MQVEHRIQRSDDNNDDDPCSSMVATRTSSTLDSTTERETVAATPNDADGIRGEVYPDDATRSRIDHSRKRKLCIGLLLLMSLFLAGCSLILLRDEESTPNGSGLFGKDRPKTSCSTTDQGLVWGPLVGHTTHNSVKLWVYYNYCGQDGDDAAKKTMQLVYHELDDVNNVSGIAMITRSVDMPPNAFNGASIIEIDNLESNTQYDYEIHRIAENNNNNSERVAKGRFKTAPSLGEPVEFSYLLASCMNVKKSGGGYPNQPVWDVIRNNSSTVRPPDFALLPGDTIYLNQDDWTWKGEILSDRVWARNLQQRAESHFADFIAHVPTYSTWDDHDYGKNNADRHQLGKENSLDAFKNLWANPSYGTEDVDGVFYSYMWGDVQFFVMDNRWYRDPGTESQFGTGQKEWLFEQLKASTSTFKVIVTASDVMERGMSQDVKDIGVVVAEHKVSGVLFNAGDIHRNEFKARSMENWPYKVNQITSSGIARVWRRPFALINVNTQLDDPAITASFYGADSNGLDDGTTWSNDPSLSCSEVVKGDRYKEHRCTELIRLSDLTAE